MLGKKLHNIKIYLKNMRKILIIFLFSSLIISCSSTKKLNREANNKNTVITPLNDGTSYENAILIKQTKHMAGIAAEYAWLNKNYQGYESKGQSLIYYKEKPYDIISIVTKAGKEKEIYFNISNFFGKY